eukprot:Selendium_serpulae@DN5549_c0_g1_i1.p1
MASFMANAAGKAMFGGVTRDMTAASAGMFGGQERDPNALEIDWMDFNYPPFVRLFHFNLAELPVKMRHIVRWIHISYLIALLIMVVNFIDCIVLASIVTATYVAPTGTTPSEDKSSPGNQWWNVLFSLLNFCIGVPVGCYVFYTGYQGLAKKDSKLVFRYCIMAMVISVCYVAFAILPYGPFNGFVAFAQMGENGAYDFEKGAHGFAVFVIVFESCGWLAAAGIGGLCAFLAKKYDPYEAQGGRTVDVQQR